MGRKALGVVPERVDFRSFKKLNESLVDHENSGSIRNLPAAKGRAIIMKQLAISRNVRSLLDLANQLRHLWMLKQGTATIQGGGACIVGLVGPRHQLLVSVSDPAQWYRGRTVDLAWLNFSRFRRESLGDPANSVSTVRVALAVCLVSANVIRYAPYAGYNQARIELSLVRSMRRSNCTQSMFSVHTRGTAPRTLRGKFVSVFHKVKDQQ